MSEEDATQKPLWNSLEITKIVVGALTPLAIFVFTLITHQGQAALEKANADQVRRETQERERVAQVTRQRVVLWTQISPPMNDLYCYFLYVGHWKEISPEQVLLTKRQLDKLIYSNSPFFSQDFLDRYHQFMGAAFKTGNGWGEDAKLRSPPIRELDKGKGKERMFAPMDDGTADNTEAIHSAYYAWLAAAAREMDLEATKPEKPPTPSAEETREHLQGAL
ncbi:hypothetical protein HNP46_003007 [Pseudomonas nitritireducens]|uniref:Uncharacterized protein n=1 Tax=Pseudomonas nitroreducens TaxID=46680 RepID=A0A7W7P0T1_PSENT|nr:hypothetical protein [Pseudomonas nitritireducens]MBB4864143.1 hypothetical protein [Pseudomonas nitritireducens]